MASLFDIYGWYTGEGNGKRSTNEAPSNTSMTTTPGQLRANWTGRGWVEVPYFTPAEETSPELKKLAILRLKAELLKRQYAFTIEGFTYDDFQQTREDGTKVNALQVTRDILIAGGSRNVVVSDNGSNILMNAAKLDTIYAYMGACSETAITHYQAIQALTTKSEIKVYVQLNLKTLWPDPAL